MTKEELHNRLRTVAVDSMPSSIQHTLDEFFSQNLVIPRGENRHKDADIIHAYAEGLAEIEVLRSEGWTEFKQSGMCLCIGDEYRIKPSKPVYEWQYVCYQDDKEIARTVFMTNDECLKCYLPLDYWIRDESTKRVRNA